MTSKEGRMRLTPKSMAAFQRIFLLAGGFTLLPAMLLPAQAQQRTPGVLTHDPGYLLGTPFAADWTFTRLYADGTERPDPSKTAKIARNSDGCRRTDILQAQSGGKASTHDTSVQSASASDAERFSASAIGSPEEQALEINTTLSDGAASYWWVNTQPMPWGEKTPSYKCRAPANTSAYCAVFQMADGKKLPNDYTAEDLGTKTIEGVVAHGLRIRGSQRIQESWCSDELGAMMIVIDERMDLKHGAEWYGSRYELKNVKRAEPDPALFQLPSPGKVLAAVP